jgi:hypothetical protein
MLKIARKELHDAKSETRKSASGIASLNTRIATAQSNLDLVVLAARLVARHFERIVQLCPHEVMHTLPSSDHASVIRSVAGCSNQDIHIDAMENGWSFLTALERDPDPLERIHMPLYHGTIDQRQEGRMRDGSRYSDGRRYLH